MLGEELPKKEFKERHDATVAFKMARVKEMKQRHPEPAQPEAEQKGNKTAPEKPTLEGGDEEVVREELALVLEQVNTRQRREQERASTACNFGPTFNLLFSHESDHDA